MASLCRIELLGGLRIVQGDQITTRFRTQMTGALLAYLAFYLQRAHPRELLIELLWPEGSPERQRNNLSISLSSLRTLLEAPGGPVNSVIVADRFNVRLNPNAVTTDVGEFEAGLKAAAKETDDARRIDLLADAVDRYRGELLPGCYEDWIPAERMRLADACLTAARQLVRLLAKRREFEKALDYARRAVAVDPRSEEAHRDLMRLYVAVGRPSSALQQANLLEQTLKESPSFVTRKLLLEIQTALQAGGDTAAPAQPEEPLQGEVEAVPLVPTPDGAAPAQQAAIEARTPQEPEAVSTLPLSLSRFIGREQELARLQTMLLSAETRLVTLLGPGGMGKTRLASELARRLQISYPRALWFVPLADLVEGSRIADATANAMALPRSPELHPLEQIVQTLNQRPSLLILDNFEQVVETGTTFVRSLLDRAEELTCLVTSRELLNIAAEHSFLLQPLPTPDGGGSREQLAQNESVQLFVDRAQAVRPDFEITNQNAAPMVELCSRLEGIPLAIELAAARTQVLTPIQMLTQIQDRFSFLVSHRRDADERHRTLLAAVDWSYQLLPQELQQFFQRLSVFRGGWSLEAAEAVCPEPLALDFLMMLRECSLIAAEEAHEVMRFRMLETLREFAAAKLDMADRASLEQRHAFHYRTLAETADANLGAAKQADWLDRLEEEHDNLRAALNWSFEHNAEAALKLTAALGQFWLVRGYLGEGRETLRRSLALPTPDNQARVRARALNGAGTLAYRQGDYAEARSLFEASLLLRRQLQDRHGIAESLNNLGNLAIDNGDNETAYALHEESLLLRREMGDRRGLAGSLNNLGLLACQRNDHLGARTLYAEALQINREVGNRAWEAINLSNLGAAAQALHDYPEARNLFEQSLAIRQALGDRYGIAVALENLGSLAHLEGDHQTAQTLFRQSLDIAHELEDRQSICYLLEAFASLAHAQRQPERAARLYAAADALRTLIGSPLMLNERQDYDADIESLRTALGDEPFAREWAVGHAMTIDEAIAYTT